MSAWELPTTVEVAGQKFAIRSDFRAVLDALAALADPELTQQEQYMACLQILYPRWRDLPDLNDALQAAFIFINNGFMCIVNSYLIFLFDCPYFLDFV